MAGEQILLDPTGEATGTQLDITDNTLGYYLVDHDYPLAEDDVQRAGSADTEGDTPGASRPQNRTITVKVRCLQPSGGTPTIRTIVGALQAKIAKFKREGGTYRRVLPDGSLATFDVLERGGHNIIIPADKRWVSRGAAEVTLTLECAPLARGIPLANITDDFSSNTIGNYTFDAGAGTLSVSGGQLVPSSTAQKRLYHSSSPYILSDAQETFKVTTGASVASYDAFIILRRLGASDYLLAGLTSGGTLLVIYTVIAGVATAKASISTGALSTATNYWVRGRAEGDLVTADLFTAAPTPTSTPFKTISYTLATTDKTTFGAGIFGRFGVQFTPQATDWRIDDLTIEPNMYVERTSPALIRTLYGVKGDWPAPGIMSIYNGASGILHQKGVVWGLESRYYQPSSALFIEAEATTGGAAGLAAGPAGASGSGNNTRLNGALTTGGSVDLSWQGLTNVGTFRVFARVWVPSTNTGTVSVLLQTNNRSSPTVTNDTVAIDTTLEDRWLIYDLGQVTLTPPEKGPQSAILSTVSSSTVAGDDLYWDWLLLVPCLEAAGVFEQSMAAGSLMPVPADGATEITSTSARGQRSGEAYWGRHVSYRGDYVFLPSSGESNRPTRFVVKTSRGVIEPTAHTSPDKGRGDAATDPIAVQMLWTPRYLVVPSP